MSRGDQLSRQWRIIQTLITARFGKSAADLADGLEIHPRTVYRDLEALQAAGFPLTQEKRDGKTVWSILDAARHQVPVPLHLTELMALFISRGMLNRLEGTALFASIESFFDKIKATLPAETMAYLEKIETGTEISFRAVKSHDRLDDKLAAINEAIAERRVVSIDYFTMSRRRPSQRKVDPYKVRFFEDTFYLIGHCHHRNAVRVFAVDRIRDIRITDTGFKVPEGFDADRLMENSFGIFRGDPVTVKIHFDASVAGYVQERIWHPTQQLALQSDGGLIFNATVAGIEEIKFWVLRWGARAHVLAPDELRCAVADEARAMLAAYPRAD